MSRKYSLAGSFIGLALVIAACSQGPSSRPSSPSSIFSSEEAGGFAGMMNATPTPSPTVDPCAAVSSGDVRAMIAPTVCYTIANVSTIENDEGSTKDIVLVATRTGSLTAPLSFNFSTTSASPFTATAGADYTAVVGGTVTFAIGQSSVNFYVKMLGDTLAEGNETLGVVTDAGTTTVTIIDNDAVPNLTLGSASVTERNSGPNHPMVFNVTLSKAAAGSTSVDYVIAGGSATQGLAAASGVDYIVTAASGTVTFAAGETAKTISVSVIPDTIPEANETLTVTLSNPVGVAIATGNPATGRINNDDSAPTLRIENQILPETGLAATFTVGLTAATNVDVTFQWMTKNVTATQGAGADFTSTAHNPTKSGTVTIPAGSTSVNVTTGIVVRTDGVTEGAETFQIVISNASGANIEKSIGYITIPANVS